MATAAQFHPLPVIGYPEAWYSKHIEEAHNAGDRHAQASYKVGQYVTLGLRADKSWEEKLKCFRHALKHYGVAPAESDAVLQDFYRKLGDVVRRQAGQEAIRLCRAQADAWSIRLEMGSERVVVEDEAEVFFASLLGHSHDNPDWCGKECWATLCAMRDRWI
ncbi:MAG: hypothetical protein JWL69_2979 [Phycisphaerales bacterium]|nr:hypothetical protein [Phycisphaerales bacterium]